MSCCKYVFVKQPLFIFFMASTIQEGPLHLTLNFPLSILFRIIEFNSMSKKTLKLNYQGDLDFIVAGLVCGYKDYRLCFELNLALRFNFIKHDDVLLSAGRPGSSTCHAYFSFLGGDNEKYHVISNKDKGLTGFYIPEMKNIDYFLVVSGASKSFNITGMTNQIRKIDIVSGVYEIKHRELKSVDAFLILIEQ